MRHALQILFVFGLLVFGQVAYGAVCDVDADGDIDRLDLKLIFEARNQPSSSVNDPRDEDGNGYITVLDGRACAVRCADTQCVAVDSNPLTISIESPVNGALVGTPLIDVAGTVSEPTARVLVNNVISEVTDTHFVASGVKLTEGENTLEALANDDRGIIATAKQTVTLDTVPPKLVISSPLDRSTFAGVVVPIVATVTDSSAVTCSAGGGALTVETGSVTGSVLLTPGANVVAVTCADAAGNEARRSLMLYSSADPLQVTGVDPPDGAVAVPAGVSAVVNFSRPVDPASVTNSTFYLKIDGSIPAATVSVAADGLSATLAPGASLPSGVPVDVILSTGIADTSGIRLAFPVNTRFTTEGVSAETDGVFGQVFDDTRSLPLAGASVEILSAVDGSVLATGITDDRGRYLFDPGAVDVLMRVSMPGYTDVTRGVIAAGATWAEMFDARLTPLAGPQFVEEAYGAEKKDSAGNLLSIAPGALGADGEIRLTPISGQGVRVRFPLGWTPLSIVQVDASSSFNPPATWTLADKLESAAGREGVVAQSVGDRWIVASHVTIDGSTVSWMIDQPGQYALLVADVDEGGPAPVAIGEELTTATEIALDSQVNATGKVNPPVGRSDDPTPAVAAVFIEGQTTLRSGTVVEGEFKETFSLRSGDEIAPFDTKQDLIAYRSPNTTEDKRLTVEFPITPSRQFPLAELLEGTVKVSVATFEATVDLTLIGELGGGVQNPEDGSRVMVPAGALDRGTPISLTRFDTSPVNLQESGLEFIGGLQLDMRGAVAVKSLALTLSGGASSVPTGSQVLIAELRTVKNVDRLVLVALARIDGLDLTSIASADGVELPGIRGDGRYLFLRFDGALDLVTGIARDEAGRRDGHVVEVERLPVVSVTGASGAFVLVSPPGSFSLLATAAEVGDQVRVDGETGTPLPEILIVVTPPRVKAIAVRLPKLEGYFAGPLALLGNPAPVVDDDTDGGSNGNGNGLIEAGERIELTLAVRNDGTVAIGQSTFVLSVDGVDGPIAVDSPEVIIESIPPDVPVNAGPFVFTVPSAMNPSLLRYTLRHATSSGLSSAIPFNVPMEVEHPDVPVESEIVVWFSEPVVRASLEGAMILARQDGAETVPVEGSVILSSDGTIATLRPLAPLADSTIYQISLMAQIVDADGRALADAPIVERLRTEDRTPPAAVDPGQIEASVPDASGLVTVTGTLGSVNPDDTVILLNETTGYTAIAIVYANGSFSADLYAEISDQITFIVRDRNGNETTYTLDKFVERDPQTGQVISAVIGRLGGTFTTAEDISVIVPAGAFGEATKISVTSVNTAFELPSDLDATAAADFAERFDVFAQIQIDAQPAGFNSAIDLRIPAPAGAQVGDEYVFAGIRNVSIGGEIFDAESGTQLVDADSPKQNVQRLEIVETATVVDVGGKLFISTQSPPFRGLTRAERLVILAVRQPTTFLAGEVRWYTIDGALVPDATVMTVPESETQSPFVAITDEDGQFVIPDPSLPALLPIGTIVTSQLDVRVLGGLLTVRRSFQAEVGHSTGQAIIAYLEKPFVLRWFVGGAFCDAFDERPTVTISIDGPSYQSGFTKIGDPLFVKVDIWDDVGIDVAQLLLGESQQPVDLLEGESETSEITKTIEFTPTVEGLLTITGSAIDGCGNQESVYLRVRILNEDPAPPDEGWDPPPDSTLGPDPLVAPRIIAFDESYCVGMSEPLDPTTVTPSAITLLDPEGQSVAIDVSLEFGDSRICIQPRRLLRLGASYSVQLSSSIEDLQGDKLSDKTLSFSTLSPALVFKKELSNVEDIALAGDTIVAVRHPDGVSAGDNGTLHTWRLETDDNGLFQEAESAEVPVVGRPLSLAVVGNKAYVGNRFLGQIASQSPFYYWYIPDGTNAPDITVYCESDAGFDPTLLSTFISPPGPGFCLGANYYDRSWPVPSSNLQVFDLSNPAEPKGLGAVPTNYASPLLWNPNTWPSRIEVTNETVAVVNNDNIEFFKTYSSDEPFGVRGGPESLGVVGWIPNINGQSVGRCDGGLRDDQICLYDPVPTDYKSLEGVTCYGSPCNEKPRFLDAVFFDDFAVSLDSDGLRFLSTHPDDLNREFNTALGSKRQTLAFVGAGDIPELTSLKLATLGAVPKFDWGQPGGTDLLFVASPASGLTILDVSEPTAPYMLSNLPGTFGTMSFDACRGLAYLHGPHGQFHIVDFNDPTRPVELNDPGDDADAFALKDFGGRATFNGNANGNAYVYLAGSTGIGIVDIYGGASGKRVTGAACVDNDWDGVPDTKDQCPGFDDNLDADHDGIPDDCDICKGQNSSGNSDNDTYCDDLDNCPLDDNENQTDSDQDGIGDACEIAITIEINETATDTDDLAALTPLKPISARVFITGPNRPVEVRLSAIPVTHATISPSTLTLTNGGSSTVTITPLQPSASINDVFIVAEVSGQEVGREDMTNGKLDIYQDGNVISGQTIDEIVGRQINLEGMLRPIGLAGMSQSWTVPGNKIKNYIANNTEGIVVPLTNLSGPSVQYYWVTGENNLVVKYSVTVQTVTFEASSTFNVTGPTLAPFYITHGQAQVSQRTDGTLNLSVVELTPTGNRQGIEINPAAVQPVGFCRNTFWVQVSNGSNRTWQCGNPPPTNHIKNSAASTLDFAYPYPIPATIFPSFVDSPGMVLENRFIREGGTDSFTTWYMCEPANTGTTPTIPIPLREVSWGWAATAVQLTPSTWTLEGVAVHPNPVDTISTRYPEWNSTLQVSPIEPPLGECQP